MSYNLKKLVEMGYMHHQRCEIDRRSVRVRLTRKGREVRDLVPACSPAMPTGWKARACSARRASTRSTMSLRRMERFWTDQIRYIY